MGLTNNTKCKGRSFYHFCDKCEKYHEVMIISEKTPLEQEALTDGVKC